MRKYKIRLQRIGIWKKPNYHIIVTFSDIKSKGLVLEKLGLYSSDKNKYFFINFDRLGFWLLKGATISKKTSFLITHLIQSKKNF